MRFMEMYPGSTRRGELRVVPTSPDGFFVTTDDLERRLAIGKSIFLSLEITLRLGEIDQLFFDNVIYDLPDAVGTLIDDRNPQYTNHAEAGVFKLNVPNHPADYAYLLANRDGMQGDGIMCEVTNSQILEVTPQQRRY